MIAIGILFDSIGKLRSKTGLNCAQKGFFFLDIEHGFILSGKGSSCLVLFNG